MPKDRRVAVQGHSPEEVVENFVKNGGCAPNATTIFTRFVRALHNEFGPDLSIEMEAMTLDLNMRELRIAPVSIASQIRWRIRKFLRKLGF